MSVENNNICNAVNCVSNVLKDFSDNQVGVITPNALVSCTGLPVSCCVLPANDLNDWYNLSLPPFSMGTGTLLFHRYDDCFYYPMCYNGARYVLDKSREIYNGDVYCISRDTTKYMCLRYGNNYYNLNNSAYEWWLYPTSAVCCDIYIYAPSVDPNRAFEVSDICVYAITNQYRVLSNGPIRIDNFGSCYKHDSIGDRVCLL